jgi:GTP-binding protein Era
VVGIHNAPGLQVVLVDTPGIHQPRSPLNRALVRAATGALAEVDAACWVVDLVPATVAAREGRPVVAGALSHIAGLLDSTRPVVVALNKVDAVEKRWVLPVVAALAERLPGAALVPLSALSGDGVDRLVGIWREQLPIREPTFPPDQLTDLSERFVVAELVREQVFRLTGQEIPYATAVEVERFEEEARDGPRPRVRVFARILVERDSQKGILIGKGGSMLKRIGTQARKQMEGLLGAAVRLELHVAVRDGWSRDPRALKELGYG